MNTIPEELKNSKCCLKCKLVDPDFTTKEMNVGSRGDKKTFFYAKHAKVIFWFTMRSFQRVVTC